MLNRDATFTKAKDATFDVPSPMVLSSGAAAFAATAPAASSTAAVAFAPPTTSTFTTALKNPTAYTMLGESMNIDQILEDTQLGEYKEIFTKAGICLLLFATLTERDLIELGVRECHIDKLLHVIDIYAQIFEVDITLLQ